MNAALTYIDNYDFVYFEEVLDLHYFIAYCLKQRYY